VRNPALRACLARERLAELRACFAHKSMGIVSLGPIILHFCQGTDRNLTRLPIEISFLCTDCLAMWPAYHFRVTWRCGCSPLLIQSPFLPGRIPAHMAAKAANGAEEMFAPDGRQQPRLLWPELSGGPGRYHRTPTTTTTPSSRLFACEGCAGMPNTALAAGPFETPSPPSAPINLPRRSRNTNSAINITFKRARPPSPAHPRRA
jgi:hypothetical protein